MTASGLWGGLAPQRPALPGHLGLGGLRPSPSGTVSAELLLRCSCV